MNKRSRFLVFLVPFPHSGNTPKAIEVIKRIIIKPIARSINQFPASIAPFILALQSINPSIPRSFNLSGFNRSIHPGASIIRSFDLSGFNQSIHARDQEKGGRAAFADFPCARTRMGRMRFPPEGGGREGVPPCEQKRANTTYRNEGRGLPERVP